MTDDRFRPPDAPLKESADDSPPAGRRGLPDAAVVAGGLLLTKLTSYSVAPTAAEVLSMLLLPFDSGNAGFDAFLFADVVFSVAVVLGFLLLARKLSQSGSVRVIHWLAGLLFVATPLVRLWIGEYSALTNGQGFPLWYELALLATVPAAWAAALWLSRGRAGVTRT